MTDEEIEAQGRVIDSHVWLINSFSQELKAIDVNQAFDFKNNISVLKKIRNKADYKNVKILSKTARDTYDLSIDVIKTLNQHFKL